MAEQPGNQTSSTGKPQDQGRATAQASGEKGEMTRRQERGGLARQGTTMPYMPSPSEFFANPFAVMRRMHEDMDRMFVQALGGGLASGGMADPGAGGLAAWTPAIEVTQRENELIVSAELPGIRPDEVQIEVADEMLTITGERRREQVSEQGGARRTERQYGRFYRSIPLPDGVDPEQVKAAFQNGMLEIKIPLPQQQSRKRQIPISGGEGGQTRQTSGAD